MKKATKNTNILKLINENPETIDVILAFGLHCVGCMANGFDTIYQGAKIHNMSDEDIDDMIYEINLVINKNNGEPKQKKPKNNKS